jgi:AhpD family alkylhydroperoxidase
MSTQHAERIDMMEHAGAPYAAMVRLEERIQLDETIRHLVKLRASQINGCAFCLDMHYTDARADGESELRLQQLAGWRDSPAFDDRERAALELTEAVTHVAETHVPDDVWASAEAHFDAGELAHLLVQIAAINFWNRTSVASRKVPASFLEAEAA